MTERVESRVELITVVTYIAKTLIARVRGDKEGPWGGGIFQRQQIAEFRHLSAHARRRYVPLIAYRLVMPVGGAMLTFRRVGFVQGSSVEVAQILPSQWTPSDADLRQSR